MCALASAQAKSAGFAWLALSGVLASACDAPYEPELQIWPDSAERATDTGGTSPQDTGGSATSGSAGGGLGGGGVGGTSSTTGGTLGASGTQTTGGTGVGGSGGTGGTGNFGGSATGGASGNGSGGGGQEDGGNGGGMSGGSAGMSGGSAGMNGGSAGMNGMNGGSGGSSGGGGSSASGGKASTSNCTLSVKVTTASAGGRYSPRNIGAIWVADQSGNFIRSLEVWAQRRVSHLTLWNSATSKAGTPGNRVDIVSQATLSSHKAHTATWACQDFNQMPVPDGTYRVYFEMTDDNATGPNRFEEFTKGSASVTLTPADNNNFKAIELSYQP